MRLGMNILGSHPENPCVDAQIAALAKAGFQAFFLGSKMNESYEKIPHWAQLAQGYGIAMEAVHAPLKFPQCTVDDLWRGYEAGSCYRAELKALLEFCARGGVGKVILHVAYQLPAPPITAEGLRSFRELEAFAKARGIRLCYENCKHTDYLAAVLEDADPFHGFCYDSGHHYCYTPQEPLLERFGERLLYTHLHDNFGHGEDLHLLPGDGGIDWAALKAQLQGFQGAWNLELSCAGYGPMSYENLIALAHQRGMELLGGD